MKQWITSLLSSCSKVSSKRVIAIFVIINLIILSYVATFTYYVCPIAMFDTLAILTGGLFTGTVLERFTKIKNGKTTDRSEENNSGDLQ